VQELGSGGFATFTIDSFAGRGIINTVSDQSQLATLAMMVDAFQALAALAKHPRLDSNRIAIMGFSKGAVAAVYSATDRFRKMYGPPDASFAAHIGLYTPCNVAYAADDQVSKKPIRLFHGIADDWVAIGPCRAYVERLRKAGADATLTEFPNAVHAYEQAIRLQQSARRARHPYRLRRRRNHGDRARGQRTARDQASGRQPRDDAPQTLNSRGGEGRALLRSRLDGGVRREIRNDLAAN
jgi:dienelactone hydrolase